MVQKITDAVLTDELTGPFSQDENTTTGLSFGYTAGQALDTSGITNIAAGTVLMSDNSTNIVYIGFDGTPAVETQTEGNKPDQDVSLFLYIVTTVAGEIVDVLDLRSWVNTRVIKL